MRPRAPALALVAAALVAVVLGACVTPSIPIPPPAPERMRFELDVDLGEAVFSYPPSDNYADAIVYVFNHTLGTGVIATADETGAVTSPAFPARQDDSVSITFETDVQVVSTCVVLRQSGPIGSDTCN